jgi:hypothetical protein
MLLAILRLVSMHLLRHGSDTRLWHKYIYIYIQKEDPELTKIWFFWTVAPMVDRRLQMQRSHRNATVLIFTCLIRMLDGSPMSSLISAVEYIRFSPLLECLNTGSSPTVFLRRLYFCPVRWPCASPSRRIEEVAVERKIKQGIFVFQ